MVDRMKRPTRPDSAGVMSRDELVDMGSVTGVMFEDTCGNLIQLVQPAE